MCGIVGMISSQTNGFDYNERDNFKELLYADYLRGEDSTGSFLVTKDGNVRWMKGKEGASEFIKKAEFEQFMQEAFSRGRILVGHNRKATKGIITDENAHPFIEGNSILVHNGTIRDHEKLTENKVDVDSHAILHSINEKGFRETIRQVNGAFALAWYQATDKKFFLARNNERPLWLANTPGCWYFASEKEMLAWILARNKVDVKSWTELLPYHVYEFPLDKLTEKMIIRPVNKKETPPPVAVVTPPKETTGQVVPFRGKGITPKQERTETTTKKTTKGGEETTKNVTSLTPDTFRIGAKVTVEGLNAFAMLPTSAGIGYVLGTLYHYPEITVRVFFHIGEEKQFKQLQTNPNDIFTAEITSIHLNTDQTIIRSLNLGRASELLSITSKNGEEIFPDDWMFSDMLCEKCKAEITWSDVPMTHVILPEVGRGNIKCTCKSCSEKVN